MMVVCIKQHLCNMWSSIHEKVKQHWGCFEKRRSLQKNVHNKLREKRFLIFLTLMTDRQVISFTDRILNTWHRLWTLLLIHKLKELFFACHFHDEFIRNNDETYKHANVTPSNSQSICYLTGSNMRKSALNGVKMSTKTGALHKKWSSPLTVFRMGLFRAAHGWGVIKMPSPHLPKICHTYPTMIKLGIVITYLRKTPKIYESRDTPFQFCWHQRFFIGNQQILLYQKIQI